MRYIFLPLLIGIWFLGAMVYSSEVSYSTAKEVQQFIVGGLNDFKKELVSLKKVATNKNLTRTKKQFLETRESFKQIEFIISYFDHPQNKKFNQANLETNAYHVGNPNEHVYPRGLQVLEEYIYSEESDSLVHTEIDFLIELTTTFLHQYQRYDVQDAHEYHTLIWDALRYEVFRIETMGITGFDVPASKNALRESWSALNSLQKIITIYKSSIERLTSRENYQVGDKCLKDAIQYLSKNTDFETFDRFEFIKTHLHPIAAWISKTRSEVGFSYPTNVQPIHSEALTLYDLGVFNDAYFASGSTDEKVELGKKLFFDKLLSSNGSRSCASCHHPSLSFADGITKNKSIDGTVELLRNTPSLWNSGWQTKQFYDSRVVKLEKQSLDVIHNRLEMGGDFASILPKIKADATYNSLFNRAFSGVISEKTLVEALSSYVKSITSFDSKFDQAMRRNSEVALSAVEKQGFNLFMGKAGCATCHFPPLFNGLVPPKYVETESEVLGVPRFATDQTQIDPDLGKFLHSGLEIHRFSFKTPGLRNVEKTAPYMHNGVFQTLEEVIEFYNRGGGVGNGIDLPNQTLPSDSLRLTKVEINALVLFLKTLTDESKLNTLKP